jgi:hypothetical protein
MNRQTISSFLAAFIAVTCLLVSPQISHSYSLNFNGNGEVRLPSNISPANITIEAWFLMTALDAAGSWSPIITKETGSGSGANFSWRIGVEVGRPDRAPVGSIVFQVSNGEFPAWVYSTTIPEPNKWYHVAGTYDGAILRLYVNGVLEDEGARVFTNEGHVWNGGSLNQSDLPTGIGHLLNWGLQYWEGNIDEIRIWDYARSETEVNDSMNTSLNSTEPGLVAYWDFEPGPNADILYDLTINDFDGTIINATWDPELPTCEDDLSKALGDLSQCEVALAQTSSDLDQAYLDLAQAYSDLAQANADLTQAIAALTQCQTNNAQCSTDLTLCQADEAQCSSALSQANTDLNQCLTDLDECLSPSCVPTHDNEKGKRCGDGLDNDCDGLIDCDDPDCSKANACK